MFGAFSVLDCILKCQPEHNKNHGKCSGMFILHHIDASVNDFQFKIRKYYRQILNIKLLHFYCESLVPLKMCGNREFEQKKREEDMIL